jgi:hypothetical protein
MANWRPRGGFQGVCVRDVKVSSVASLSRSSSPARLSYPERLSARVRSLASDPTDVALIAVFLLGAVFYFWRATYAASLSLHGGQSTPYNELADAFLHLHLWVVNVPAEALASGNPYNPAQRSAFLFEYPDYALYGHYLYLTWGAAPVFAWVLPLHLLGFEPSASVISLPFVIVGLGFALATLRVILRQIGDVPLWICILAGLTLFWASVIPYIERFPLVYHEEIAGGYCFAMIAIWCGASAVANRRASLKRLAAMSLFIGLATATRPTLGVVALLLIAVYFSLRRTRSRRGLLLVLGVPFGVCALLLGAYNFARFDDPFQYGAIYQINGVATYTAHFGEFGFLAPGLWAYLIAPPRLTALFPFLLINYPQVSYPLSLPAHYISVSEETGGLLSMAPIAIFLVALPAIRRRRSALLGPLSSFLLVMVGAGIVCLVFLAYEFYTATERYEADYITLLLFGGLAAWAALSRAIQGRAGRLIKVGGGVLALWSCVAGMGMTYQDIEMHPASWRPLVDIGAPLSTAIAAIAGHPVLAEVFTPNTVRVPPKYANLGTEVQDFYLTANDQADVTIVSPDSRKDAIVANTSAGQALAAGASPEIRVTGPGPTSHTYPLPGGGQRARIPVRLHKGVNQLVLSPGAPAANQTGMLGPEPESLALVTFSDVALASG